MLAQGEEMRKQLENSVPYLGLENEKRQLPTLLVKAIFEFSSSSGFVLPDELCTPIKQAPPAAKPKPKGAGGAKLKPQKALPSKASLSRSCNIRMSEDIQRILKLRSGDSSSILNTVCVMIMKRLAVEGLLRDHLRSRRQQCSMQSSY